MFPNENNVNRGSSDKYGEVLGGGPTLPNTIAATEDLVETLFNQVYGPTPSQTTQKALAGSTLTNHRDRLQDINSKLMTLIEHLKILG